jgi:hypothetical protein
MLRSELVGTELQDSGNDGAADRNYLRKVQMSHAGHQVLDRDVVDLMDIVCG